MQNGLAKVQSLVGNIAHLPRKFWWSARIFSALVICCSLISPFSAATQPASAASRFLKANGTVLRDNYGTGGVVNLRGTNLGGWLLQEAWMSPGSQAMLNRAGWSASASSTEPGGNPNNALDGNSSTRWSSGAAQANGQWFKVDMGSSKTFDQIIFDAAGNTGDYPVSFNIKISGDNSNWQDLGNGTGNGQKVVFGSTQTARYILITQTGAKGNWWSIAEFNVSVSDQYTTYSTLYSRFGEATADNLMNGYHDAWIQAGDLDNIKNMGMNAIRVPIYWEIMMRRDGTMKSDSQSFRELDWVINQSAQRGLYVILDLHGLPGGDCPWQSCGISGSNQLWNNATYQDWTVRIWQRIATRYKDNPTVAGYDFMNEPLLSYSETAAQIRQKFDFYNRMYQAVRAIDPDHLIIVAAFFSWSQALPPSTYGWTNVMYQTHHYDFGEQYDYYATSSFIDRELQTLASYQQQWNVPVYAGEFWFGAFNDLNGKFLSGVNALNISWTNWAYKNISSFTAKGTDGGQTGINWGFYLNNPNPVPDINTDDAATIASKWSKFNTANFQPNTGMIDVYTAYTKSYGWSSLKAMANNSFVSADNYGNNPLIANRTTAQGWEQFQVVNNPDGTISLLSQANNKYVTADLNQGNKLIARANGIMGWEKFKKVDLGNGTVALQAVANNKFVSCDLSTGSPVLVANRDAVGGSWEAFVISPV